MIQYFRYTYELLKHKWYVIKYGLKLKVPFYLLLIHDISKFHPDEFFAYANHFYNKDGSKREVRDETGGYDPSKQSNKFKLAWLHHQNNNKHHWQYWIIPHYNAFYDDTSLNIIDIPKKYIREMIADWISAGICISKRLNPIGWYNKTKRNMAFTDKTLDILEKILYNEVDKIL